MASELSINISQLQELATEVQKTKKPQTVQLADGVVAVVKPEQKPAPRKTKRLQAPSSLSRLSLEDVFGAVPTPAHLRGRDIDEMIREAKDERADRLLKSL
jgi:hypothetical protein